MIDTICYIAIMIAGAYLVLRGIGVLIEIYIGMRISRSLMAFTEALEAQIDEIDREIAVIEKALEGDPLEEFVTHEMSLDGKLTVREVTDDQES